MHMGAQVCGLMGGFCIRINRLWGGIRIHLNPQAVVAPKGKGKLACPLCNKGFYWQMRNLKSWTSCKNMLQNQVCIAMFFKCLILFTHCIADIDPEYIVD